MTATAAQLADSFGPRLKEDVVEKLTSLSQIFNVSANDLFINWETFNVTVVEDDLELTTANLDQFQEYLQSTLTKGTPSVKRSRDLNSARKPMIRATLNSSPSGTPSLKRRKADDLILDSSPAFETANNTFQSSSPIKKNVGPGIASQHESNTILETLNPELEELPGYTQLDEDASTALKPFKLASNFDSSKYKFRTMSMKLLESADVLDDQIDTFAQIYQENNKLDGDIQFGNPCISAQFDILCSGRIVPDSPTYDAFVTLNSTSLFLETSRMSGIGQRIPLDISQLKGYSFFPGQIVVLKGRNPTGRTFVVQEVKKIPELGAPVSSKEELSEFEQLTSDTGLKLVVSSGPYSNQHTLNYSRLERLVDRINTEVKPHAVVLNGPFIDINNISVAEGDLEFDDKQQPRNLDEVFKKIITPILKKINPRIQVILFPSLKDTCIKHCSYPQDSFDRKKFGLPKNVKIFPNPSSFSLNEVIISNSNLDIFKDLKDVYKEDASSKLVLNNRFERIATHVFEQRRFYPTFPGSIKKNIVKEGDVLSGGVMEAELSETGVGGSCLEVPYLGLTELGTALPDILVIPSELKFFVKVIKGVVVINPGYYIKAGRDAEKEDGTYAVVHIQPPKVESPQENNVEAVDGLDLYYHNLYKRTRVDIFKS